MSNLTVWWSNQLGGDASAEGEPLSILDKSDLRTNVIVLSAALNLSPESNNSNMIEYLAKSDGCLLSLSYADDDPRTLIAVEQFESTLTSQTGGRFSIEIYKHCIYEDRSSSKIRPKRKLTSFNLTSRVASSEQVRASKRYKSII